MYICTSLTALLLKMIGFVFISQQSFVSLLCRYRKFFLKAVLSLNEAVLGAPASALLKTGGKGQKPHLNLYKNVFLEVAFFHEIYYF